MDCVTLGCHMAIEGPNSLDGLRSNKYMTNVSILF